MFHVYRDSGRASVRGKRPLPSWTVEGIRKAMSEITQGRAGGIVTRGEMGGSLWGRGRLEDTRPNRLLLIHQNPGPYRPWPNDGTHNRVNTTRCVKVGPASETVAYHWNGIDESRFWQIVITANARRWPNSDWQMTRPNVCDAGPAVNQHWCNVFDWIMKRLAILRQLAYNTGQFVVFGEQLQREIQQLSNGNWVINIISGKWKSWYISHKSSTGPSWKTGQINCKSVTLTQCIVKIGPASQTMDQHWKYIG